MKFRCLLLLLCCCLAAGVASVRKCAARPAAEVGELRTGVALLQRGKYSEPQQELLAATGHHSSAESFFYLGMADFNLHHLAAAEEALGEAWRLDPRSGSVNYNIGVVLLEQKRARDALPFLHRASTIGPGSTETAVNLVRAYLGNNQEEEGPAGIKSSLARYGQDPAFALTLGKGLLAPGLTGPARELLTTADRAAIGGLRRAAGNPAARAAEGDFQSLNVPCWARGFGADCVVRSRGRGSGLKGRRNGE